MSIAAGHSSPSNGHDDMSPDSRTHAVDAASGRSPKTNQPQPTTLTLFSDVVACMTFFVTVIVVFGIPLCLVFAPQWIANPNVVMFTGAMLIASFTAAFVALFSGLTTFFGRRRTINSFRAVVTSMISIILLMGLVRIGWELRR